MKTKLIGVTDPRLIAREIRDGGFGSCAEAEAAGWFVTSHAATRAAVDRILASGFSWL